MLLEIAIGDAYGIAYELVTGEDLYPNDLAQFRAHPKFQIKESYGTGAGMYTDDTQMSIAVAEALITGEPLTSYLFASKFVEAFKRNPRAGYAPRFYEFLKSVTDVDDFLARIKNDSRRNGAAMRSCPIGFMRSEYDVLIVAGIQAAVTHNTADAVMASRAVALMTHYMLYNKGPKAELGQWLNNVFKRESVKHEEMPQIDWSVEYTDTISINGLQAAHAAVSLVQRYDSMREILWHAVNLGGDTDSGAAMALGAASCSKEVLQDLPQHFFDTLEDDNYGRTYLMALDNMLRRDFGLA